MINLIPNEEKKKTAKDFYVRFVAMFFIMLGTAFLFASISILPSYFYSSIEKNVIATKLAETNNTISVEDQGALKTVKDLKNKLSLVEASKKREFVFSKNIINEIVLKKTPGIKITEISYQDDPAGKKVNIAGIAKDRQTLLLFKKSLADNIHFSNIDLPISNFVKDTNIKFYLSLNPS